MTAGPVATAGRTDPGPFQPGYTEPRPSMVPSTARRSSPLPLVAALAILAAHAALFGGWIVDDAGITFAYARNLALGHGAVSQPGVPPVEGYSNPSWMLVAAFFYLLRLFVLPWTPKILAGVALVATFVVVWRDLARRGAGPWTIGVALGLLAGASSFVIWSISGLENALLAWLAAASASLAMDAAEDGAERPRRDLAAGAIAAVLALTRPDAILYAAGYPFALVVAAVARRTFAMGASLRALARLAAGFVPIFGGYLAFRFLYFGDVVPNTFHAKVKTAGSTLLDPGKLLDLFEAASGDFLFPVLLGLVALAVLLTVRRAWRPRTIVLNAYLVIAAAIYMILPLDWMGEFRFATPFFLFFYWFGAELITQAASALPVATAARLRPIVAVITVIFVAQAGLIFLARSLRFAADPTVPVTGPIRFGAQGFNALAARLPQPPAQASLLTPDLGGVLLQSDLRVYDLAGLCDPVIARALHENPGRLRDYVFDEVRPTFIHTQGAFTRAANLHEDPRFARDYVALHEGTTAPPDWSGLWRNSGPPPPFWGDYVRRDAVSAPGALEALMQEYRREGLTDYAPWVRPPDRLKQVRPQVRWAIETIMGRGAPIARPASVTP